MKNTLKFALVGAFLAVAAPVASAADAQKVTQQITKEIKAKPSAVLSIVKKLVTANKENACELVKTAIVVTEADKNLVGQIVETAIVAAPTKASLITTCALAVAPDAHVQIRKAEAKHAKNSGGSKYSAKDYSSKGIQKTGQDDPEEQYGDPLNFDGPDATGNYPPTYNVLPPASNGAQTPANASQ